MLQAAFVDFAQERAGSQFGTEIAATSAFEVRLRERKLE